ncbi:MAG: SOS response-associated peptidase family protein [Bacteroidetes bacterium]|nr:SOS response-associated peptidase family protein [Bacteroidota bacterium]
MCYYNGQLVTRAEYIRLKGLEKLLANYDFLKSPLQDGFAFGNTAVLKRFPDREDFDIVQMEWGFLKGDPNKWPFIRTREDAEKIRRGYKDEKGFHPGLNFLNAVAEELLLPNKVYRDAALNRRCLVLSSGFYEWRHVFPKNKRTGEPLKTAVKYPYRIGLKGKEYFYMAGIWEPWTDQMSGEHVDTFAIVTTKANELMKQVHNSKERMPTILNEDLAHEWMFGNLSEDRITEIALTQYPYKEMEAYPIAKDFKSALDPTAAFKYDELPELVLD